MKNIILIFTLTISALSVSGQDKYTTNNGTIKIYSTTPVENIDASNNQVQCLLNKATGVMAFKVVMKGFAFNKAAMQDHFNKDYVHSDKYPHATFEGTITNNSTVNYSKNGTYTVNVNGKLTIHGITREIKEAGTIEVKDGKVRLKSIFNIKLSDFGITISAVHKTMISNTIQITVDAILTPYTR